MFTIGYHGNTAIVDRTSQQKLGKLPTEELLERGMFKAAFCAVLDAGSPEDAQRFLEAFNRKTGCAYRSVDELKRLFGVFENPKDVVKITAV
jgi:hypothetical protein